MKRRPVNVFSLALLDCITCGLGAIILLFVIINTRSAGEQEVIAADLAQRTSRAAQVVLDGQKELAVLQDTLAATAAELQRVRMLTQKLSRTLREKQADLADRSQDTLARTPHINRLKADIKVLEEELRRLKAGARHQDVSGDRLRAFPGEGDRQYLTDLKMGGRRILILVDASASMLDETVVGVIRRRNLSDVEKLHAPKWRRVVSTVEWLVAQLPSDSRFQVYTFNETARALAAGTGGGWLDAGDIAQLNATVEHMQRLVPAKGTSLLNAFKVLGELRPAPDNIFLLTDGLPTMGERKPWRRRVSGAKRLKLFAAARRHLIPGVPVNIILFPMEGDPRAADAYWRVARQTRGSFFSPARDWP